MVKEVIESEVDTDDIPGTAGMIIPGSLSYGFPKACTVSFPNNPNGKGSA